MDSGMIGKIEKAKRYAEEKDRITLNNFQATFKGDNNDHVVYNHHGALDAAVDEIQAIMERERENPERPIPRLRD